MEGLIINKPQDPLEYLLEQLKRENDDSKKISIFYENTQNLQRFSFLLVNL